MRIAGVATPTLEARPAAPAREVPTQATPVSRGAIRDAIGRAYHRLHGSEASAGLLDTLTAHASVETAAGRKMMNFNFAGIKGRSPEGATARYRTFEILDGKRVNLTDGFRAYSSLEAGATDYLKLLEGRYRAALAPAAEGDLKGFAEALRAKGYYTASAADYTRALEGQAGRRSPAVAPAAAAPIGMGSFGGLDASSFDAFTSASELAKVLDAVSAASARLGAPDPEEES